MKYKFFGPERRKLNPLRFLSFDIETTGDKNDFYICGFFDGENYHYTLDREEAQRILLYYDSSVLRVANNLNFDLLGVFYNSTHMKNISLIQSGGKTIIAEYNGYKTVKFFDAMNYGFFSVEQQGKILGIPKLEKPTCFKRKPDNDEELKELVSYNKRDCEVTYKYIEFWHNNLTGSNIQMKFTIASTSMNNFKRNYMDFRIKNEYNKALNNKLFKAYYGGRVEAFKRGLVKKNDTVKNGLYLYDFNSLYPSCMINEFPKPDSFTITKDNNKANILFYEGVSHVCMKSSSDNIPLLPLRKDKLIFPNGNIRGWYTHAEIRKALEEGYLLIKIYESITYSKTHNPFQKYVLDIYSKRELAKKDGSPLEYIYKLMLNSLYGRFALRHGETLYMDELRGDEYYYNNESGKGYGKEKSLCDSNFVLPIYSIYTTSWGRIKLFDKIKDTNPYYIDTDSVFSEKELNTSNKLGELKLESHIKEAVIVKPKLYKIIAEKTYIKAKGFPKLNEEGFGKLLNGEPVEYEKFIKLREAIRRNKEPNEIIKMTKYASLQDDKRIWKGLFNPTVLDSFSEPRRVS
jgi:hypothetical protein